MANIVYVGVFLNAESKEKLLSKFSPIYGDVHADHMTVMYKPSGVFIRNFDLGKKIILSVVAYGFSDKAQAVFVDGMLSININPHITVSVNKEAGGKAKDSNEIQLKTLLAPDSVFDLEGVLDVFPRSVTQ